MEEQITFEFNERPTIKGFPELRWTGKRPYRSTQYFPAQLRERYGEEQSGWINKIFWGDNLQVMSHLLKEFRGKVDLIYIDPPFDSKAEYKKKVKLRTGKEAVADASAFEEKQYGDIWTNDEYLQFMYERFIIMEQLLAQTGTIYVHCDWHKNHHLRCLLDSVFGVENFRNEISWQKVSSAKSQSGFFSNVKDTILIYTKTGNAIFNPQYIASTKDDKNYPYIEVGSNRRYGSFDFTQAGQGPARIFGKTELMPPPGKHWIWSQEKINQGLAEGRIIFTKNGLPRVKRYLDEKEGNYIGDMWNDAEVAPLSANSSERLDYPTQKPEALIERIIKASSNPGALVFDCFMGSGTAQAVAMKMGRRFIGADINLGAIQTTTKRLINIAKEIELESKNEAAESGEDEQKDAVEEKYTGFEVYNVNNYDFFRNPVEARDLLIEALGIQPFTQSEIWDGELDGRMVKIMPVNRIATKADLEELKANLPYKIYEKRKTESPGQPVEMITIICMGHEPDLKASLEAGISGYKLDVEIVDILRDKSDLQFKRDAEADIIIEEGQLILRAFYPLNLMQKLSLQKEYVEDWRQLVESVMIDWNYDGVVMQPTVADVPDKNDLVKGIYEIPEGAGTIKVKITDLLSESLEIEV